MPRYDRKDRFYKKAKQEGYAARSIYKLEEIDERFSIFFRGDRVLDLGCAPGSWLQYIAARVGSSGVVVGYDIAPTTVGGGPNVKSFVADVFELTPDRVRADSAITEPFDVVVSDLAPKTTGIRDADQARSIGLVEHALDLARVLLAPGRGRFCAKVFHGRGFDELLLTIRARFQKVRVLRPEATRAGSREAFIVAEGLKPE